MFYTKEVKVYRLEATENEWGEIVEEQYMYVKDLTVDVQPYSREKLQENYGYKLDTTKRMFCDLDDDLQEDTIIKYRGSLYKIVNIVEWDDYLDIALDAAKGVDINE